MGGAKSVPGQRHVSRRKALRIAPSLKSDALVGGIRYHDTVVDADARHTLTLARTAAHYGAVVRTTQAVGFVKESDRVTGVTVRDSEPPATMMVLI